MKKIIQNRLFIIIGILVITFISAKLLPSTIMQPLAAISSVILLIITTIYVFETNKMASFMKMQSDIMTKEFELKILPLIKIKGIFVSSSVREIQHNFTVENCGNFPIEIKRVGFTFSSFFYHPFIKKVSGSELVNKILLPTNKNVFQHIITLKNEENERIKKSLPIGFSIDVERIDCTVIYSDVEKKEHELTGVYTNEKYGRLLEAMFRC